MVERSAVRRDSGAALSLWGNAWRALDALGVGPALRKDYIPIPFLDILDSDGKELRSFSILEECSTGPSGQPHEVRGVKRAELLRALEDQLPAGTVLYGTQIRSFQESPDGQVTVQLANEHTETTITAQALIASDGARSATAAALGLPGTNFTGYVAARGLARLDPAVPAQAELAASLLTLPGNKGQSTAAAKEPELGRIRQIWGRGVRAGIYPLTPSLVYWFTCANWRPDDPSSSSLEELRTDKQRQKEEALASVEGWGGGIRAIIEATPADDITTHPIADRWDFAALLGGRIGRGAVTLIGDAAHPMTPNLGQGACTALEDAVVLAQCLSRIARDEGEGVPRSLKDKAQVVNALAEFERVRAKRVTPLVLRSNLIGTLLQIDNPLVCGLRDNIVMPYLFTPSHFLDHALFDCGELPVLANTRVEAVMK